MKYSIFSIYVLLHAAFLLSPSHAEGTVPTPEPMVSTEAPSTQPKGTTHAPGSDNTTEGTSMNVTDLDTDMTTDLELTTVLDLSTPDLETSKPECNTTTDKNCSKASPSTPSHKENSTTSTTATEVNPETDATTMMPEDLTTALPNLSTDLPGTELPGTDLPSTDLPSTDVAASTVAPDTTSKTTPTLSPENPVTSTPSTGTPEKPKKPTNEPTNKPTDKPSDKPTEPAKAPTTGALTTKSGEPNKTAVHHGNASVVVGLVVTALLLILVVGVIVYIRQRRLRNSYGRLNEETEDSGWSAFSKNPIYRGDRNEPYL